MLVKRVFGIFIATVVGALIGDVIQFFTGNYDVGLVVACLVAGVVLELSRDL